MACAGSLRQSEGAVMLTVTRGNDIHLDALRSETLVTRQRGSDNRRIWDELMEKRSVPLAVGAEAASNEMLKEMAAAGVKLFRTILKTANDSQADESRASTAVQRRSSMVRTGTGIRAWAAGAIIMARA